eukprot:15128963-Alexandrium_andersonii.AAC.1
MPLPSEVARRRSRWTWRGRSTWREGARPGSLASSAAGPPWLPRTGACAAPRSCGTAIAPGSLPARRQ